MLDLSLEQAQKHENLTVFPLCGGKGAPLAYQLLIDALMAETLHMTEVGSGTVPTLLAESTGDTSVLILDGEQLIGAKQNRITNRTIILAAHSKTEIPVTCMEGGRWRFDARDFKPARKPRHAPTRVRRHARKVEAAYAAAPELAGVSALQEAQSVVWSEISDMAMGVGASSPTGAMDALYDAREMDLDTWLGAFAPAESQVGFIAFLGNRPLGMDMIEDPGLYARLHERLLGGYVMDALADRGRSQGEADASLAGDFLGVVRTVRRAEAPTVGLGIYRLLAGDVVGGELEHEERIVHLSAFPAQDERGRGSYSAGRQVAERPLAPPSRRRRSR